MECPHRPDEAEVGGLCRRCRLQVSGHAVELATSAACRGSGLTALAGRLRELAGRCGRGDLWVRAVLVVGFEQAAASSVRGSAVRGRAARHLRRYLQVTGLTVKELDVDGAWTRLGPSLASASPLGALPVRPGRRPPCSRARTGRPGRRSGCSGR